MLYLKEVKLVYETEISSSGDNAGFYLTNFDNDKISDF